MATNTRGYVAITQTANAAFDAMIARFLSAAQAVFIDYDRRDGQLDNEISIENQLAVTNALTALLLQMFLTTTNQQVGLFDFNGIQPRPLTPFARILWQAGQASMQLAVDEQARILRTRLRRHPEIVRQLERANVDPFALLASGRLPASVRDTLVRYELPIAARRGDGRTLTDRVITATMEARRRLTMLLGQLFAEGKTVNEILATLRTYYTTGFERERGGLGKHGLFEIRRILTSEPIFAHSMASFAASALNPFVQEVWIERTRNQPCPICDPIAKGSPYNLTDAPLPGYHSHCLCRLVYRPQGDPSSVIVTMRDDGLLVVKGALSPDFLTVLLRANSGVS